MKKNDEKLISRRKSRRAGRFASGIRVFLSVFILFFTGGEAFSAGNLNLVWTGDADAVTWDESVMNWAETSAPLTPISFLQGDRVYFGAVFGGVPGEWDITITPGGVTVADMIVDTSDGNFIFWGDIYATTDASLTDISSATGWLTLTGGGTLTMNGNNRFDGGGDVQGAALIMNGDNRFREKMILQNAALTLDGNNRFREGIDIHGGMLTVTGGSTALGVYTGQPWRPDSGVVRFQDGLGIVRLNVAENFQNRFEVAANALGVILANENVTISGVQAAGGTQGGAFFVDADGILGLAAVSGDITLTGNIDADGNRNDIYLGAGARLGFFGNNDLTEDHHIFINSGISGGGAGTSIYKAGPGILQIAADSAVEARTELIGGRFRVVDDAMYGDPENAVFRQWAGASLEGNGTIAGSVITLAGRVSPDSAILASGATAISGANRFGTLTLDAGTAGTVTFNTGFIFDYDMGTPAASGPTGDLLRILGGSGAEVYLNAGTVNFSTQGGFHPTAGRYLVIDSDTGIFVGGSGVLDGINDLVDGVLKAEINGTAAENYSPRNTFQYNFTDPSQTQIVLDVERHTLTMDRNTGGLWDDTAWESKQENPNSGVTESVVEDGDYAHLTTNGNITITLEDGVGGAVNPLVSGLTVGSDSFGSTYTGNVTINGTGGITAVTTDPSITGQYLGLPAGNPDLITPDGKLRLMGSGPNSSLTLANTGGNYFSGGVEIYNGTLELAAANVVDAYAGGTAGVITFKNANGGAWDFQDKYLTISTVAQTLTNRIIVEDYVTSAGLIAYRNLTISGVVSDDPVSGAILIGENSSFSLMASGGNITFTGNTADGGNPNDIHLKSGAGLDIYGGRHIFINDGITGGYDTYFMKNSGTGILQISADSAFLGYTEIDGGRFRVVNDAVYGDMNAAAFYLNAGGSLAGNGTISADYIQINGRVGADSAILASGATSIAAGDRFGTLTLSSNTDTGVIRFDTGFIFDYDMGTPDDTISTGDLLRLVGGTEVLLNDGTINLRSSFAPETGSYLIIDSETAITLGGGHLDGINYDDGVLKATLNGAGLTYSTPRGIYEFRLAEDDTQVWFDILEINSLVMDWTGGGTRWNPESAVWDNAEEQWRSVQTADGGQRARNFMNGDYVHIYNPTWTGDTMTITLDDDIIASGMEIDRRSDGWVFNGDIIFDGEGGITLDAESAVGRYVPDMNGSPAFYPTGALEKYGTGTLTLANTGTNVFHGGITIYDGTLELAHAGVLGAYDGSRQGMLSFLDAAEKTLLISAEQRVANFIYVESGADVSIIADETLAISGIGGNEFFSGGAIYVGDGGVLTLNARNADIFFTGNAFVNEHDDWEANDIYLADGSLNLTGDHNIYFNSGISNDILEYGYITKTGDGFVQIGGDSWVSGETNVVGGAFRIVNSKIYGEENHQFFVWDGAALAGTGAVRAGNIYISGLLSPDAAVFSPGMTTISDNHRVGVLLLEGNTFLDDVTYDVDILGNYADMVVVSKALEIDGGTLNISVIDGIAIKRAKKEGKEYKEYVIMTAGEDISGIGFDLGDVTDSFKVVYQGVDENDPTQYIVRLIYDGTIFSMLGGTSNASQIGDILDEENPQLAPLMGLLLAMDEGSMIQTVNMLSGGEMVADMQTSMLWKPWRQPFRRYNDTEFFSEDDYYEKRPARPGANNFWFDGFYHLSKVTNDKHARSYDVNRPGATLGYDRNLSEICNLGLMFTYSHPTLKSIYGKVETNDFTFGLYTRTLLSPKAYMNLFAGGGFQSYDYRRNDPTGVYSSTFNGNTFFASAEFVRAIRFQNGWTLLPLFAMDYQVAWTNKFEESAGWTSQTYRKSNVGQFVTRFGLLARYEWQKRLSLDMRLQYGYMLGGRPYGFVDSSFAGVSDISVRLRSVSLGYHQINAGFGTRYYLTESRNWALFADYDFDCARRAVSHTGQVGVVWNF